VLAHYGWLQKIGETHPLTEFSTPLVVPPGSVMLYDFYTDPSFQRQGLYTQTLRQMLRDCRQAGATNVFIAAAAGNSTSRRVIERAGFVPYRVFTRTQLLGYRKENVVSCPSSTTVAVRAA
jgi:RimJ/RimL family protein N-acetyltransferase